GRLECIVPWKMRLESPGKDGSLGQSGLSSIDGTATLARAQPPLETGLDSREALRYFPAPHLDARLVVLTRVQITSGSLDGCCHATRRFTVRPAARADT